MRNVTVFGGSGRVGARIVMALRLSGHTVTSASPSTGVDAITGHGVREALAGADVVIDATNAPQGSAAGTLDFFTQASRNILDAGTRAGVKHHVLLSVVGADRLTGSPYMRAKVAQEAFVRAAAIPWTIVRATQFFEFVEQFPELFREGETVKLPMGWTQPLRAEDAAAMLADVALEPARRRIVELGGPDARPIADFVRIVLARRGESRPVVADPEVLYFGARLSNDTLLPGPGARLSTIRYEDLA
ncbi:MAG TPA: NAD(P)H-binding protein [Gemmatimonadaceae bacterium]|nr:NAD(P)H-binding protein [Gemmatimonadaceae bacterium]